jgi:hypothetical protein
MRKKLKAYVKPVRVTLINLANRPACLKFDKNAD